MRRIAGLCVVTLLVFAVDQVVAQESGLFSGKGIKDNSGWGISRLGEPNPSALGSAAGQASEPKFKFPEIKFPKLKAPKWEMPKLFRGNQYPDPIQLSDSNQGMWPSLPKFELFQPRHSDRPNFFQRMNDRTKEIFGKTKENFSNLSHNAGNATRGTWDSVTRSLNGDIGGSGNRNQPPIQPNLRSARNTDGTTPKKF